MRRIRRFVAPIMVAMVMAGGMALTIARVEAAGKKPGGGGQDAVCGYLLAIINYEQVNPYIKLWATSLYNTLGCEPALP